MKGKYLLLIICVLSIILCSVAQNYTVRELQTLSEILYVDDSLLVRDIGSARFLKKTVKKTIPNVIFGHDNVLHINSSMSSVSNVLIIVNQAEYNSLENHIRQYAKDIHTFLGYGVDIEVISNGNYVDIKQLILSYANHLIGTVLIGDVDVALFEIANDHSKYGYRNWPCDLYYMDLDGVWTDNDSNGIFDSHKGNIQPEIFVGRITATNIGNQADNIVALSKFFKRDHLYWTSQSSVYIPYALSYTNKDWVNSTDIVSGIDYLYGSSNTEHYKYGSYSSFGKDDYSNKLQSNTYAIIQLAAHSNPQLHQFTNNTGKNEYLYANTIYNIDKKALGYNLFCCSACNWLVTSSQGYLGGVYLFNTASALFVIGSTKTGSMLGFQNFYIPLTIGECVGEAIVKWWNIYPKTFNETNRISWFYGLSLLGDPFVKPFRARYCSTILKLENYDTSNPSKVVYYRASEKIIVCKKFVIPSGVKVILDAPKVEIEDGFECPFGASLETRSVGCN